jgi:hypothetical protein
MDCFVIGVSGAPSEAREAGLLAVPEIVVFRVRLIMNGFCMQLQAKCSHDFQNGVEAGCSIT